MVKIKENIKMQQITIKLKVDDLNNLREYADKKVIQSVITLEKQYLSFWKIIINIEISEIWGLLWNSISNKLLFFKNE
jgi:hypothetical protein